MHRSPAFLFGLLALTLVLGASPARALDDHVIEVQLGAAAVAELVRAEARANEVCPTAIPCPAVGGACFLDHVEVVDVGTFRRGDETETVDIGGVTIEGVAPIELVQPVDVFVKTAECVNDPSCGGEEYLLATTIDLVLELSAQTNEDGDPEICAELVGTEPSLPSEGALPDFSACGPLALDELAPLLGDLELERRGVSLNGDADRLAIRLDFSPDAANTGEWTSFLTGSLATAPAGSDLAVVIDRQLLTRALEGYVDVSQIPDFIQTEPQSSLWLPLGPLGVAVAVTTTGSVPVPTCGRVGVDVIVNFFLGFDASASDLTIDAEFEVEPHQGDLIGCSILNPLFGGPALSAISLGVMNGIGQALVPDAEELQGQLPGTCNATGDDTFSCRFPADLPPLALGGGPFANLELQDQMGTAGSYALSGPVTVLNVPPVPMIAHQAVFPFQFNVGHDCDSWWAGYTGAVSFSGHAAVCGVDTHQELDPLNVFEITQTIENGRLPAIFEVELAGSPSVETAYWNAPYDPQITIYTTGGARTVSLGVPSEVSSGNQQLAIAAILGQMEAVCAILTDDGMGGHTGYDPRWDIDPAPIDRVRPADMSLDRGETTREITPIAGEIGSLEMSSISIEPAPHIGGQLGSSTAQAISPAALRVVDEIARTR